MMCAPPGSTMLVLFKAKKNAELGGLAGLPLLEPRSRWKDSIPLLAASCPDFWHQFRGQHCRLGHFCLDWFCFISKVGLHPCTR